MGTTRPSRAAQPSRAARPTRAAERRERMASEGRAERRIYLAAALVGLAVVASVVAGVLLTVVLPPRTAVVKVGGRTFTARDLAVRVKHAVIVESNSLMAADPASAIPVLAREEVLRQKAADLGVSPVADSELKQELRKRIGAAEDLPDADFQLAYGRYLKAIPVTRSQYEEIVRGDLLRQRASDTFKAKTPETGPQLHLLGVTSPDRQKVDDLRAAVATGKDFKAEAVSRGLARQVEQLDLSWVDPESLPEGLASIRTLKAGDLSEVIPDERAGGFFLAQVAAREEDRKYEDPVKAQIANRQLLEWVKRQESALVGPSSLSGSAKAWVDRQVKGAVADATRRAQEAQRAKR